MANKTKKYYYYVLVFDGDGPAYVTSKDYKTKMAYWNKDETPMEFNQTSADDLTLGLLCNGYNAMTVKSPIELDSQPYRYGEYEFEIKRKDEKRA